MRIDVWDHGFKGGRDLRNYTGLRIMSFLDHLVQHVQEVTVNIADVDPPAGGIEKRCRMLARLVPAGEVRVEGTHSGLYAAIDRAAERLADAVTREMQGRDHRAAPLRRIPANEGAARP